jgi:mRNA-degrading endonuclease RelE of RelBE toxin-antitoxin system
VHRGSDRATPYEIEWSAEATADLAEVPVFYRGQILIALERLCYQAEMATRHRKPLREPIEEIPEAAWEVRVGEYRGLYRIKEGRTVRILRVILKGRRTALAAVMRGIKP